jgi:hypothetical protein
MITRLMTLQSNDAAQTAELGTLKQQLGTLKQQLGTLKQHVADLQAAVDKIPTSPGRPRHTDMPSDMPSEMP